MQALSLLLYLCISAPELSWHWENEALSTLDPDARDKWRSGMLKELPQPPKSSDAIEKAIQRIEQNYLEMNFDELEEELTATKKLLWESPPYANQAEDFKSFYEIVALYEYATKEGLSEQSSREMAYFLLDKSFGKKLPGALQFKSELLQEIDEIKKLGPSLKVFGEALSEGLPESAELAATFVDFPSLVIARIHIDAGQIKIEKIKEVELFEGSNLARLLEKTRPTNLVSRSIRVFPTAKSNAVLIRSVQAPPIEKISEPKIPFTPSEMEAVTIEREDRSILKSPWFWLALGVAAAGGGYLIYEGSRGTTQVRTP